MKELINIVLFCLPVLFSTTAIKAQDKIVTITTSTGTMKARLYPDVPNHTRIFSERATRGDFNGTLFTRVIPDFMIQGGSPDSRNAAPGRRIGDGDRSTEILPEFRSHYFAKKGVLAAPRQNEDINPQKKSDMSQFFIVHGKIYTNGELDTLQLMKNQQYRKKALDEFYYPVQAELRELRQEDPQEFNRRSMVINAKIDSVIRSYPDHLIFSPEQREAYTTIGGSHHLDNEYTIFGELIDGFDVLEKIAVQARDANDRPVNDIQIITITVE